MTMDDIQAQDDMTQLVERGLYRIKHPSPGACITPTSSCINAFLTIASSNCKMLFEMLTRSIATLTLDMSIYTSIYLPVYKTDKVIDALDLEKLRQGGFILRYNADGIYICVRFLSGPIGIYSSTAQFRKYASCIK